MPINSQTNLSLLKQIKAQIKIQGPMSLATYMRLCLTHPEHGYYKKIDPLGTKGDFVTAPEISQMFGEMLGAWARMQWHNLGCPSQFDLVELGPGRGTLMADAMRVLSSDPKTIAALSIVLLETNPVLIELQREKLNDYAPIWIEEIKDLAHRPNPKIIIANEFFDALPIKQFQFQGGAWYERLVGSDEGKLVWGLSPTPMTDSAIAKHFPTTNEGEIWETSPLAAQTIKQICDVLNEHLGAMIAVDYGYDKTQTGDTFQAIKDHKFADPLQNPGQADLSSHVDFSALINAAREMGSATYFAGSQGQFLKGVGIEQRSQKLCKANPIQSQSIKDDLARLIDPDKMGDLFKVMYMVGMPSAPMEQDQHLAEHAPISHGFFGRQGGCSASPFSSFNVSKSMGDHPENVANNRANACATLDISPDKLAILKQTHSADIIIIDEFFDFNSSPEADGMVTKSPGIGLGILTADCTPVLFADPTTRVVGACHAGWQGAVSGIITNTILAMEKLGAMRSNIIAAFGPTIWPQNYEVGSKWVEKFLEQHPSSKRFILKSDKNQTEHFDLPGFVRAELKKNQVANIAQVGLCTYDNPDKYFSHRFATHKAEKTGRQIAVIGLRDAAN